MRVAAAARSRVAPSGGIKSGGSGEIERRGGEIESGGGGEIKSGAQRQD